MGMIKGLISKYSAIIVAGLVIVVISYIAILKYEIKDLNLENEKLSSKLTACKLNKANLEISIKSANKKVEEFRFNMEKKKKEYLEKLNEAPKVKYKYIYKEIPTLGKDSNECKDIKKLLGDIRVRGSI